MLTEAEHREPAKRARSRTGRAEDARRARVILLLAEGLTWDVVWRTRGVQPRLRGDVGTTLSGRAIGRVVQPTPRSEAVSLHAERGGEDPQESPRREVALR